MKIGHLFKPRMRPQAVDVQAAVMWAVAAGTTAIWLVQSLQALKKIAQEHPTTCLRRVALSTAANMCKKLPSDAADFVMEAVPLLTNLLQYHDAKVLEHASVCLTRIAEAFASTPDKLDELCNHRLVTQAATLRRRSLIRGHFFLEIIKGSFKFCTKILL